MNLLISGGEGDLARAARLGDVEEINRLLDRGDDIEGVGMGFADTPLVLTTRTGHFEATKALLERGANPQGRAGFSGPIRIAVRAVMELGRWHMSEKDLRRIENIWDCIKEVSRYCDLEEDGLSKVFGSPLSECCNAGRIREALRLVEMGANPWFLTERKEIAWVKALEHHAGEDVILTQSKLFPEVFLDQSKKFQFNYDDNALRWLREAYSLAEAELISKDKEAISVPREKRRL